MDKQQPLGHHVAENHRAGEKVSVDFQKPFKIIRAYGRQNVNELCGKRKQREQNRIAEKQNPADFAERQAEEFSDQNVLGDKKGIRADSAQDERGDNNRNQCIFFRRQLKKLEEEFKDSSEIVKNSEAATAQGL